MPGRLGLEHRDGDALDVGQAERVFEQADLPLGLPLVAPQLDLSPELLAAVLHPLLDGVPPVGVAVGDEHQPRAGPGRCAGRAGRRAGLVRRPATARHDRQARSGR